MQITRNGPKPPSEQHWLMTTTGTKLSLAMASGLIAYYLGYSIGVRLQITPHEQRRTKY